MAQIVFANDTYFYLAGGSLTLVQESDIAVEMKEETIVINLQDTYYEVAVDFTFYNPGRRTSLLPWQRRGCDGGFDVTLKMRGICWADIGTGRG